MKTPQQKYYKVFSFLLSYPTNRFFDGVEEAKEWIKGFSQREVNRLLLEGFELLKNWNVLELQKHYVSIFDFRDATALHLTALEHGDSRDRGIALVRLKAILGSAGYEELDGELPDYIPLLFEYLAEEIDPLFSSEIEQRLAKGVKKILTAIDPKSPYTIIFLAAQNVLPDIQMIEEERINPEMIKQDLEELPYPLYYEH